MDNEEIKKQFQMAKNNNSVLHIKGLFNETPTWNNFIDNLDYSFNSGIKMQESGEKDQERLYGMACVRSQFHTNIIDIMKKNSTFYPGSELVKKNISDLLDKKISMSNVLINFVTKEKTINPHKDLTDVVSWHCIGSVEWRIFNEDNEDNYDSYILNPGDVLYVPEGKKHTVVALTPRASIIFILP